MMLAGSVRPQWADHPVLRSLQWMNRDAACLCRGDEPAVVARKREALLVAPKRLHRREVQGIERAHRDREGLQRPLEVRRQHRDQADPLDQRLGRATPDIVRRGGVQTGPDLVFEQAARYEPLGPKGAWRQTFLVEEQRQRDRAVEIDQRSSRSRAIASSSSAEVITGFGRGGGPDAVGRVIEPSRTIRAITGSDSQSRWSTVGGRSSATTRSRSVTSTVSPASARRTYSLSLFLRTLRPTERMAER